MHGYLDKNGLDESYPEMSEEEHLRHSDYVTSTNISRKRNMKKGQKGHWTKEEVSDPSS